MKTGPGKANPFNNFLESCKTGNLEGVNQGILQLKDDIITKNGNQALQVACQFGQFQVVSSLLKVKAIRNLVSADDNCAIRTAAEKASGFQITPQNKHFRIV